MQVKATAAMPLLPWAALADDTTRQPHPGQLIHYVWSVLPSSTHLDMPSHHALQLAVVWRC
jgi:hypothetical protein